jgi:predicted alpha/beta-hydrolase family hydrolase
VPKRCTAPIPRWNDVGVRHFIVRLCYLSNFRSMSTPFHDLAADPPIRGFLHLPSQPSGKAIVLTHGAGANCQSKLLIEMSEAFANSGFSVLRFDLPFRLERPHGPPSPGTAARDRQGLRRAVALMKGRQRGPVFLGGHSYGGRQSSMLVAEAPGLADGLLLLSYPLHPPKKPDQLRTAHLPKLNTPVFFVHGTRDPFGTIPEMKSALKLIPAAHALIKVDGAGHDLLTKKIPGNLPALVVSEFCAFLGRSTA